MLKEKTNKNIVNMNMFALISFACVMLFSFNSFAFDTITTESPFISIANLPFYRMEIVSIIFSVGLTVGGIVSSLFKRESKYLMSIPTALLAILTLVIAFFNVDIFQQLSPLMRISHVTMSISRMLTIILAVSSLIFGFALVRLFKYKWDKKYLISAVLFSTILSALAISTEIYVPVYVLLSAMLFISAFIAENGKLSSVKPEHSSSVSTHPALEFLTLFLSFVVLFICPNFIENHLGFNSLTTAIILGLILLAGTASIKKPRYFIMSASMLLASLLGYAMVHYVGEEIVYSRNRVVNIINPAVFIVILSLTVATILVCKYVDKKKN